jgi:hypothetical protein
VCIVCRHVVPGASLLRSSPSAAPTPLAGVGVGAGAGGVGALGPLCEGPAPAELSSRLGSWGSAGVGAGGGVEALLPLCEGPAPPELGSWGSGDMGVASGFVGGAVLAGGSVPYTGWGYCAWGTGTPSASQSLRYSLSMSMDPGCWGVCCSHQLQAQLEPCLQLMHCQSISSETCVIQQYCRQQGERCVTVENQCYHSGWPSSRRRRHCTDGMQLGVRIARWWTTLRVPREAGLDRGPLLMVCCAGLLHMQTAVRLMLWSVVVIAQLVRLPAGTPPQYDAVCL